MEMKIQLPFSDEDTEYFKPPGQSLAVPAPTPTYMDASFSIIDLREKTSTSLADYLSILLQLCAELTCPQTNNYPNQESLANSHSLIYILQLFFSSAPSSFLKF